MQKTVYENYKYSLQDTAKVYIGAKYTFAELLEQDDVAFKFRLIVERYILAEKRGGSPGHAGDSSVLSEAGQFSCEDLRPDQGSGEDQYHRGEKKDFRQRQKALCHEGIEHPGISCHDTGGERGEGCRDSGNLHEQAGTGRVLTD